MKHLAIVALVVATAACNNKAKDKEPTPGSAGSSGSAMMAGSGSAMAGSDNWGSNGSGSAMMAGSGSAMAGSGGSGMAMGSDAGSGAGSDSFNWEAMTHEQRVDYMKHTVVPTMKPLFQKFDAKHYANFGCKTCHGKDPKASKFKMPNGDLPKLDFVALKAGKQKPEIAKWMGEVVKPQMAKLMHEPEYTEANPKGFGCLECHMEKKK
ncbi:MAG TPA: hypothetical protein VGG28_26655 [Kofleriaceae bacterium]|jgi:hypothetical protein